MKISFNATFIVDMENPKDYGWSEPTITGAIKLINSGKCKAQLASDLFIDPVIIIKDHE